MQLTGLGLGLGLVLVLVAASTGTIPGAGGGAGGAADLSQLRMGAMQHLGQELVLLVAASTILWAALADSQPR